MTHHIGSCKNFSGAQTKQLGSEAAKQLCHPELVSGSELEATWARFRNKFGMTFKFGQQTDTVHSPLTTYHSLKRCAFTLAEVFHPVSQSRKIAFTLAEVLITLGIIGVVAALTMPSLIQNHQKKQTVAKLQKGLSALQQAIKLSEVDNGEAVNWTLPDTSHAANTKVFAENLLFPYLKTIYTSVPASENCWTDTKTLSGKAYNNLTLSLSGPTSACANLNDGSSIYVWAYRPSDPRHAQVFVDINGYKKGPNMLGKDVFNFFYYFDNGKFKLLGSGLSRDELIDAESEYSCNKDSEAVRAGLYCGALIIFDGWKIAPDYPW